MKKLGLRRLILLTVSGTSAGCATSHTVKAPETEIRVTKDATKESLLAAYNHFGGRNYQFEFVG